MNKQKIKWVVVFDSTMCRIYDYHKTQLTLIRDIQHPENREKDVDITSDLSGHYQVMNGGHGAYAPHSDPKEIRVDTFAREMAHILDHARVANTYEQLILVGPPHIHGLLLNHMTKQVKNLVERNIEKDLVHMQEGELLRYINQII